MSKLDEQIDKINPYDPKTQAILYKGFQYYVTSLIASTIQEIMPEETDNDRLYLMVGDKNLDEESARLYAQLRQHGHNMAIRKMEQNAKDLGINLEDK